MKTAQNWPKAVICVSGELQESAQGTWEHMVIVLRTLQRIDYHLIWISQATIYK